MAYVPARDLPDSDADLVRLAAAGDEAAFARIIRIHHADLVRLCRLITGEADLAQHAVSDAWPVAWRRLPRLREPDRISPWLAAIAASEACRVRPGPWLDPNTALPQPAEGDRGPAADPALAAAIDGLSRDDRARLALRFVARLDWADIARAIGGWTRTAQRRGDRLAATLAAGLGMAGPTGSGVESAIGDRLRACADVPVRSVDADRAARIARAELREERRHLVSVVIAAVLAVIVVGTLDFVAAGEAHNPNFLTPAGSPAPSPVESTPPPR